MRRFIAIVMLISVFPLLLPAADAPQLMPKFSDREFWKSVRPEYAEMITAMAAKIAAEPVAPTSFYAYLRGGIDGNLQAGYDLTDARHGNLLLLVTACCVTGDKDKYLPVIIDYLWAICEEEYWCAYTHADQTGGKRMYTPGTGDPMVDAETSRRVDLYAAGTGADVALAVNILEDELRAVSPAMVEHIKERTLYKTVDSVLDHRPSKTPFWLDPEIKPNNWTPWCSMNLLITALAFGNPRAAELVARLDPQLKLYIDTYPDDGFCDEGATYWNLGMGNLLYYLTLRRQYFPELPELVSREKLRRMAEYIIDIHITPEYSASYADADAYGLSMPVLLHDMAAETGSDLLAGRGDLEGKMFRTVEMADRHGWTMLPLRFFRQLVDRPSGKAMTLPGKLSLFGGRFAVIRSEKGFSATLKGGNNAESHNHNDLGHFTVFHNGKPLIVDPGSMRYNQASFGLERYKFWYNGAFGHNAPEIDGISQQAGARYTAEITACSAEKGITAVADLKSAYPDEAGISGFTRRLETENSVLTVRDIIGKPALKQVKVRLFTPLPAEITGEREVIFSDGTILQLRGIAAGTITQYQPDEVMAANYGKELFCIELAGESGDYELAFSE